ncbi:MAG: hypothetical protein RLZ98_3573 [Pseudomonadota bacterium]|jgi:signal transduction histidine kinase
MFRRLYRKIYLLIIATLVATVIVAGVAWRIVNAGPPGDSAFEMIGILAVNPLPPPEASLAEHQRAVMRLADELGTDVSLFDASRELIASSGPPLPLPRETHRHPDGRLQFGRGGPVVSFRLPDDRWVAIRAPRRFRYPALAFLLMLSAIAGTIGLCAYPLARGLTRRLEKLQVAVETLGQGRLATRVEVEGKDEIASLASSFNRSAERIEELIASNRMLLANASHELRTPLTRIRLGIEQAKAGAPPDVASRLETDIGELDQMIDELLLTSRLDTNEALDVKEEVDLLGLAAEECARYDDCTLDGAPVTVKGDPALLRRLIRNLLDNAVKHGKPPVEVRLARAGSEAVLEVADHGDGIPEGDRDRVFAPFYRTAQSRPKKGAGLGLALVRQIAGRHGGRAEVAVGALLVSTVRVRLPAG